MPTPIQEAARRVVDQFERHQSLRQLMQNTLAAIIETEVGALIAAANSRAEKAEHQLETVVIDRDAWGKRAAKAEGIIADSLQELPVGSLRAHTPESIPGRIAELVKRYAQTDALEVERDAAIARAETAEKERDNLKRQYGRVHLEVNGEQKILDARVEVFDVEPEAHKRVVDERDAALARAHAAEAEVRRITATARLATKDEIREYEAGTVWAHMDDLKAKLAEREKFKAYIHKRLDDAGVPVDPESPHKAEGCRIGGRLDIVLDALAIVQEFAAEPCAYGDNCPTFGSRHGRCIQCKAKVALRIGPGECPDCKGDRATGCAPFCAGMQFPVPANRTALEPTSPTNPEAANEKA